MRLYLEGLEYGQVSNPIAKGAQNASVCVVDQVVSVDTRVSSIHAPTTIIYLMVTLKPTRN